MMTEDLKPLPVKGYTEQSPDKVALVNRFKEMEERMLREIDMLSGDPAKALWRGSDDRYYTAPNEKTLGHDPRWLAIARTHIQEGFMALNRAVFQPQRIKLSEDGE